MTYTANIGALAFRYVDAAHACVRPFETLAQFTAGGEDVEVATVGEDGHYFLVIDHRVRPQGTSRAEFWVSSRAEGPVEGLFVLADATSPDQRPAFIGGLRSLARLIAGTETDEVALAASR